MIADKNCSFINILISDYNCIIVNRLLNVYMELMNAKYKEGRGGCKVLLKTHRSFVPYLPKSTANIVAVMGDRTASLEMNAHAIVWPRNTTLRIELN